MDPDISRIAQNIIRKPSTNEVIKMETLWEHEPCVIIFFRRFGCVFCRQCAKEICAISSLLAAHHVKLVGVGFDEFGVDEFVREGYFDGELYLDPPQVNYRALGFRRFGYVAFAANLFNKRLQQSYLKIIGSGIKGNLLTGDGFQNGGALVVSSQESGSKVLLSFRQENPCDYVSNNDVLNVLGIHVRVTEV